MALYYDHRLNKVKFYCSENKRWHYVCVGWGCAHMLEDTLLFALAKRSGPENTTGGPAIWVIVLLLTKNCLLEGLSVVFELLLLVYLKYALPFSPQLQREYLHSFRMCESPPFIEPWKMFLPVPWFSSSQWVPMKPEKKCFHPAHAFGMNFLTPAPPAYGSDLHTDEYRAV